MIFGATLVAGLIVSRQEQYQEGQLSGLTVRGELQVIVNRSILLVTLASVTVSLEVGFVGS